MQHFFADRSWVQGDKIRLEGSDVNHMKNVLRMKEGEEVQVSDGTGNAYLCQIEGYEGNQAVLKIREKTEKGREKADSLAGDRKGSCGAVRQRSDS